MWDEFLDKSVKFSFSSTYILTIFIMFKVKLHFATKIQRIISTSILE
jgi:uncharacterized membrane protein YesL